MTFSTPDNTDMATPSSADPVAQIEATDPEAAALMERMWKRRVFVAISTPIPGGPSLTDYLTAHLQYQISMEKQGVLVASGPLMATGDSQNPQGMVVIRAESVDEAQEIFKSDPLHESGVREYRIYEWQINEGSVTINFTFSDQSYDIS